jgi:hypothetical protein
VWPFNKILNWIDRYYERQAIRRAEEEEALFQRNLENLWQKPEEKEDEDTNG